MSTLRNDFRAFYGLDAGENSEIVVMGTAPEVDGSTTSLVRAEPQGINPKILMLNLRVKPYDGPFVPHTAFEREIRYSERAEKGAFSEVSILAKDGAFTLKVAAEDPSLKVGFLTPIGVPGVGQDTGAWPDRPSGGGDVFSPSRDDRDNNRPPPRDERRNT